MESLLPTPTLLTQTTPTPLATAFPPTLQAIGFYFSAHWCGPCRSFTPKLIEYYNEINKDEKIFEIVFLSSDRDEGQFTEYRKSMPWLALDIYAQGGEQLKSSLSAKYGVRGIPSLVILTPEGELITDQGRTGVMSAPEEFPWTPKTFWEIMDGELIGKNGVVAAESLKEMEAIGVYFSAHWCGPCQNFTPKLVKTYNALKESGKNFEIVFASSDRDTSAFDQYYGEMPWLAIPFNDNRKEELSSKYKVEGIPTLVIIDPATGKVINDEGVGRVSGDLTGSEFPWHPKPLYSIDEAPGAVLNEKPVFIAFYNDLSDEYIQTLNSIAAARVAQFDEQGIEQPVYFVYANKDHAMTSRLEGFLNLDASSPLFVLLNLGIQKKSVLQNADFTADSTNAFIDAYLADALDFVHFKA